ncbi:MAG: hypothetical protein ACW98Y_07855 [Candidatus Thorarchaeota archaeon]|jgi:hypothetical protein
MLEYTIATVLTGAVILCSSLFRARKLPRQKGILQQLNEITIGHSIDFSGKTQYVGCFAHQWVVDNITTDKPGRTRVWIREQLDTNPIIVISLFALFAGTFAMSLVFLFFASVVIIGGEVGIFFVGALVIIGTGAPRISEELLDVLQKTRIDLLNWRDYAYAYIARRVFIRSLITTSLLGFVFIVLSPWAITIVNLLAQGIVLFSDQVVLLPAIALAEFNMGLAFLYMTSVLPVLAYTALKLIEVLVHRHQGSGMFFFSKLS